MEGRSISLASRATDIFERSAFSLASRVMRSREIGQVVKVGLTERKDGPDDGKAGAIFG